jgi:hypothetical protein
MWRRVDLVWTDVSEERIASIFRVEKSDSDEPAWAGGRRLLLTLVPRSRISLPWSWRPCAPPKRRFTQDLHGAQSQKTAFINERVVSWIIDTEDNSLRTLVITAMNKNFLGTFQQQDNRHLGYVKPSTTISQPTPCSRSVLYDLRVAKVKMEILSSCHIRNIPWQGTLSWSRSIV